MGSGRATPEPMKRPSPRPKSVSAPSSQASSASSTQSHQQQPRRRHSSSNETKTVRFSEGIARSRNTTAPSLTLSTRRPQQNCLVQSAVHIWIVNLAAFQTYLLTAFALGWALSSGVIGLNNQPWTNRIHTLHAMQIKKNFPDIRLGSQGEESTPSIKAASPTSERRKSDDGELKSSTESLSNSESDGATARAVTSEQKLLQKHFDYLMPWISSQPSAENEDEAVSESKIAHDFHCMSMRHFTEMSTAIYRDVRRRESQPSPNDVHPRVSWDQCIRNAQNESRILLCRTINEQFNRLVLALVLEQSRRLTELKIRARRKAVAAERVGSSPLLERPLR